jgi:hypothetical protein
MNLDKWANKIITNWENHKDREIIKENLKAFVEDCVRIEITKEVKGESCETIGVAIRLFIKNGKKDLIQLKAVELDEAE